MLVRKRYGKESPQGNFDETIDMEALMHNEIVNKKWTATQKYYDFDEILENAKLN